jgi:hypothetical protein
MSWPNKVYSQSMVPAYTRYNDTNMLFRYSGIKRDGKYLDASGNGNSSTLTEGVSVGRNKSIHFAGQTTSTVKSPITGTILNATTQNHSMGALVRPVVPSVNHGSLFGKGVTGAWSQQAAGGVEVSSAGNMQLSWFNGAVYQSVGPQAVTHAQRYHALYVFDNVAWIAYFYINGILKGSVGAVVFSGAVPYLLDPYRVGHTGSTLLPSNAGSVQDCTLWSRALVASDVRKEWLQYAPMVQLKTGWGAKVSIANENTVGNFVGNGSSPFEILSGTWKTSLQLVDGELHKVIECVAAGTVWLDRCFMGISSTEASYGSWRLSYGHAKDTVNVAHIGLTSTSKAAWDAASNTGYVLRLSATAAGDKLLRYSGGGAANLCFNMPNSSATTNQVQITRRFDNVWQGYQTPYIVAANALLTPPWAPSADGPFTDATYTTSAGMSFTFNPGDWVSLGTVRDTYSLTKFLGEFDPREV